MEFLCKRAKPEKCFKKLKNLGKEVRTSKPEIPNGEKSVAFFSASTYQSLSAK